MRKILEDGGRLAVSKKQQQQQQKKIKKNASNQGYWTNSTNKKCLLNMQIFAEVRNINSDIKMHALKNCFDSFLEVSESSSLLGLGCNDIRLLFQLVSNISRANRRSQSLIRIFIILVLKCIWIQIDVELPFRAIWSILFENSSSPH